MSQHNDYVRFIQQSIESVCPYKDEPRRRLYHAGFLVGYLATLLERDPWSLKEFKRKINDVQNKVK